MKLNSFLDQTLLMRLDPSAAFATGKPLVTEIQPDRLRGPWAYKFDVASRVHVRDLECYVPDHGRHMRVCNEISWDSVNVSTGYGSFSLPLNVEYLLGHFVSKTGSMKYDESKHWALAAKSDSSFMLVFGYEIFNSSVSPFANGVIIGDQIGIDKSAATTTALSLSASNTCVAEFGECHDIFVAPLRILVCVSFVVMHARQDFDPAGALVACRFYPIFEIMMTQSLEEIVASITYKRPERMSMQMPDMESEIRSGLWADSNQGELSSLAPPLPEWQDIFDYYLVDRVGGIGFRAVDRSKNVPRSLDGEIEKWVLNPDLSGFTSASVVWSKATVTKMPGQGAFDNLHLAPRMVDADGPVVMAPICQHDCMHTHWRWGSIFHNKESKGWDADFPHQVAGAPLVPTNQDIDVTILSDSPGFRYVATVKKATHEVQTIINHHGSAYGVAVKSMALKIFMAGKTWPQLYRYLRLWGKDERVKILNGNTGLAKLRKL